MSNSNKLVREEPKYYRLLHPYKGHHYFKVNGESNDVVKVTIGHSEKKGKAYCPGISFIHYNTFISSYGWYIKNPKRDEVKIIIEITKQEYESAFKLLVKKLSS